MSLELFSSPSRGDSHKKSTRTKSQVTCITLTTTAILQAAALKMGFFSQLTLHVSSGPLTLLHQILPMNLTTQTSRPYLFNFTKTDSLAIHRARGSSSALSRDSRATHTTAALPLQGR